MLSPRSAESRVAFVDIAVAHGAGRPVQYTFAAVLVRPGDGGEITMTFQAPSTCTDESDLVVHLGSRPVASVGLLGWGLVTTDAGGYYATARAEPVDHECERSGCKHGVSVRFPYAGYYEMCWSHAIPQYPTADSLFVPTENSVLNTSRHRVYTFGDRISYGECLQDRLPEAFSCLRGRDRVSLRVMEWLTYPYFNLWIGTIRPDKRCYLAASGARIQDRTAARVLTVIEVQGQATPIVCGCPVVNRSAFTLRDVYVPLSIPERATREYPAYFSDNPHRAGSVLLHIGGKKSHIIELADRRSFGGIEWLEMHKIN